MIFTPSMTGIASPSPLPFAFSPKRAPHSHGGVRVEAQLDAGQWHELWQQTSTSSQRALYLHIPFCRKRCSFCNFFENGAKPQRIADYVEALSAELRRAGQNPLVQSRPFQAVYIGGGTPSDMTASQIALLLRSLTDFPLSDDAEITLEGRLNGFGDDKWQAALNGGVNRFSFGVQSFDTQVRLAAGRLDSREKVIERLQQLSRRNDAPVIADLIFGLPWQDERVWQQDIADVIESGIHGVDLYQLITLSGSRIQRQQQSEAEAPRADSATRARMYAYGAKTLEAGAWQALSCNHWRRDVRERSRYNHMAKAGAEIIPFGAGAGGNIFGYGIMYGRELSAWQQALKLGIRPPAHITAPVPKGFAGTIKGALDSGSLAFSLLPDSLVGHLMPLFLRWQSHGLAELSQTALKLSLAGRFWNVSMQSGLFEYLERNPPAEYPSVTQERENCA